MFSVIRVDSCRAEALEPLGAKRKFWFTDDRDRPMLFKAEDRGTGEDWAEKIACKLCGLLGLPHVHYDLALETESDIPGVVCENCAPVGTTLVLGNQLLLEHDPAYPAEEGRRYKVREHTVDAVSEVMDELTLPPAEWIEGLPPGIESALDVFIGYVMLDGWIANQDRHHENWGALRVGKAVHLAPTFDHGASMARNLTDKERKDRLTTADAGRQIRRFARRAKSAFYADAGVRNTMTTLDAWAAFSHKSRHASKVWLEQLREIDENEVQRLLDEVPPNRLSKIGRDFTLQLLAENRRRLLHGDDT